MKSIITQEVLDQVWEIGHQRVIELTKLKGKYPTLSRQVDTLKQQYIICLNAISVRDFNRIEKTRIVINNLETELEELQKEYDADQKRFKKAKQIKEDASIEVIDTESEGK
ncbi:MAG: hypothetical protein IJA34_08025 [Lachnospiraceae bacterium]|nr:hypothetical protein [Lachnospiraceae bacterium]